MDARAVVCKVESFPLDNPCFVVVVDRISFPEDVVVVVVAGKNFRPVGDRASGRVNEFVRDVEPVWKVESVWNVDANDDKVSQLVWNADVVDDDG